jgi:hypothetical protein
LLILVLQGLGGVILIAAVARYAAFRAAKLEPLLGGRQIDLPATERRALKNRFNAYLGGAHIAALSTLAPLPAALQELFPDLLDRAGTIVGPSVLIGIIMGVWKRARLESILSVPPSAPTAGAQFKTALIGLIAAVALTLILVCLLSPTLLHLLLPAVFKD